ncbi:MAG: PAS domain-containing protein [Hyphomicrobiaceae bacterium]
MINKTSLSLFEYWNNVRGDRIAPNRFEIEPSNISGLLPETILLERRDSRNFSFRLAGTTICEQFGTELRGKNFLDGFSDIDQSLLEDDFAAISLRGGVGLIHIDAMGRSGKAIRFEVVIMPLTHTRGTLNRCLGSISALSLPDWVGEEALHQKVLLRHEIIWPDGKPRSRTTDMHRQAPFLPHVRNARIVRQDRRQFRVYDGGLADK